MNTGFSNQYHFSQEQRTQLGQVYQIDPELATGTPCFPGKASYPGCIRCWSTLMKTALLYRAVQKEVRPDMLTAILAALASFIGPILLGLVIFLILAAIFA